jgi:O-antigen ligase
VAWGQPTRLEIYERALRMIQAYPLGGVGLNAFPYVLQRYYPFSHDNDFFIPHAHNLLFQTALDYGLPGLVCLLALIALALHGAARGLRGDVTARWLATGVVGSLVAYVVFGLLDVVALGAKPTFLLWMVLGLGVALGRGIPVHGDANAPIQISPGAGVQ